ncbi:glycosyl transferase family 2 [Thermodesulfomicrobium sp. WS]|uniref:glycosyltransferase family 2 protein n=1 Tax=Thermodesulfomicrobium sp. WS TaxID=3004129 RepID=UPI0024920CCA|nr:glycosyltransferase family 2 protein [Thermodesulfomicrobium sp. WS]BDV00615.1 glycosyl transferase family 2 [Thermodesulfomicrobium sp. WS]
MSSRPPITGLVLTKDGERHLEACLCSLAFCDEILVVDSESTDRTRDIAAACGARVLVRHWTGPADQFRFAFAEIHTPWVVSLDQDEILSPALQASIQAALADPGDAVAFLCPRASFYFDRFLRHSGWYPDLLPRVFLLEKTEVHVSPPHYGFRPHGPTRRLAGDILHYPYANLAQHVEKMNAYTQIAAQDLVRQGKHPSVLTALAHGLARFAKIYVLRAGFLDGRAGFVLAINGFFYAFHKYLRATELALHTHNTS